MVIRKPNKVRRRVARIGEETRTARIELRVTPTLKRLYKRRAKQARMPLAQWIDRVLYAAAVSS